MLTIQPDSLQSAISEILDEYQEDVREAVDASIVEVAKSGAKVLKTAGTFGGSGKYKKSWASKIEKTRIDTTATLYNKMPGLPHLLEFGHLDKFGRRVARPYPHIAPVNEEVQSDVVKKIEEKISKL